MFEKRILNIWHELTYSPAKSVKDNDLNKRKLQMMAKAASNLSTIFNGDPVLVYFIMKYIFNIKH
ncbi:hypothetical protein T4B_2302 [Trichinella pseudospiralis]|uniref:Uncharacterized protein n=1 Tax=Trichinella pseudospiralis TaxID=6337 RepID=A0A0V1EX87_TRIPS|nr:hypothetical protein T4A_506 [Trichinella pseudospiralis]KRZ22129.1 hypothetical protein T4B_2302 [Trichinella pseudospiralis]